MGKPNKFELPEAHPIFCKYSESRAQSKGKFSCGSYAEAHPILLNIVKGKCNREENEFLRKIAEPHPIFCKDR